ncbi:NTP transferase domain-containing protein, partial [Streptomyces sp. LS1784]|uniref:NTP transferase domain-containing protein n=1 Tax=Streptomyces sp. LS1784 TaxID=2851533 RepID=UPI0035A8EC40
MPPRPPRPGPRRVRSRRRTAGPRRSRADTGRMTPYDAIVPSGGTARRLGGADKPGLTVGEATLLDRVLAACAGARTTVVVGPARPTARA